MRNLLTSLKKTAITHWVLTIIIVLSWIPMVLLVWKFWPYDLVATFLRADTQPDKNGSADLSTLVKILTPVVVIVIFALRKTKKSDTASSYLQKSKVWVKSKNTALSFFLVVIALFGAYVAVSIFGVNLWQKPALTLLVGALVLGLIWLTVVSSPSSSSTKTRERVVGFVMFLIGAYVVITLIGDMSRGIAREWRPREETVSRREVTMHVNAPPKGSPWSKSKEITLPPDYTVYYPRKKLIVRLDRIYVKQFDPDDPTVKDWVYYTLQIQSATGEEEEIDVILRPN